MKASELVKHLNKLIKQHGDIDVMKYDNEYGGHYPTPKPKYCDSEETFSFDNKKDKFVSKKIIQL